MNVSEEEVPKWVTLGQKALSGNILITGSIGTGKTQGTILPYFDQVLQNFDPSPPVVAIDPKGSFVNKAVEIVTAHRLGSKMLIMDLEAGVTFNPIYQENALKKANYQNIASMIRAAAANYSGSKSPNDTFWEQAAFNLTKNALVYCAAVYDYYTLTDLYTAINLAVAGGLSENLEEALEIKNFDEEEKTNIENALSYFTSEFNNLDSKVKTGVHATVSGFLNVFQEYRAQKIFCPKKDERTIKSFKEILDNRKILLFAIHAPGLSKAMGTFIKLHYEKALLDRLTEERKLNECPGFLFIDEYQDVVSVGHGEFIGDDKFLAKAREANAVSIFASQSLISIVNSLGKQESAKELFQNFRTRIALHSSDHFTVKNFQELVGYVDKEKISRSFSEVSQDAKKNLITGRYEGEKASISESYSSSTQKEYAVTSDDFSGLKSFEAFAFIYDGVGTSFKKLFLKPYFLDDKRTSHKKLLESLAQKIAGFVAITSATLAFSFPNVCDVVNTPEFQSCMDLSVGSCMCPGTPPYPCASFTYYVPDTFIEVFPNRTESLFKDHPGATAQLSAVTKAWVPFGTEGNDYHAFQSRAMGVPFADQVFSMMPCQNNLQTPFCFGAMSEHLGESWVTGAADWHQPQFLAWSLAPKPCLLTGAATSLVGGGSSPQSNGSSMCSADLSTLPLFPPSTHQACTGWGLFYPRSGTYEGPSQTTASLMIASRLKSIGSEVFQSLSSNPDEKWQMIYPNNSGCFREGQNAGLLDTAFYTNDRGRTTGKLKGYLYVTWKRVSCCKELTEIPLAVAAPPVIKAMCVGGGGIL